MSSPGKLRRRKFLQAGATAAAAGAGLSCSARGSAWRTLDAPEARALAALCDRIIPADEDAGAASAGVTEFIDRQLAGHYREHRAAYRAGLSELDRIAREAGGAPFADLPPERQDAVVARLERGQAPARLFFDLVVAHAMQAFYGSPRHGGNREAASWRMLGIAVSPVRGRARYDDRKG